MEEKEFTALERQGQAAKEAARELAVAGSLEKNRALDAICDSLLARQGEVLAANAEDLAAARAAGMSPAMQDRLMLDVKRITGIVSGVNEIIALPDPIGQVTKMERRPNGLQIGRRRVPLGVVGMIYEARPNVTVDAAALCLKTGNAVILRGGHDAIRSNLALTSIMRDALAQAGLPRDCISLVEDTSRRSAVELMNLTAYLDVLIPRGSRGLIRSVVENAKVPVIETGSGVCHVYVDEHANLKMAADIITNAKCSRPSVCNAAECLLVHHSVAQEFLPMAWEQLKQWNVEIHGDSVTRSILGEFTVIPATEADWDTEYGDYKLAVRVVSSADEAMDFIARHGTGHSEAIVTESYTTAQRFLDRVDAAAVYVNASTRFTDGGEFGLGAEIGISTQKLHARGPMGLEEMTSSKYIIYGNGQIR
ncbi:MAG: glutamate-5-semialdehyde dehydrogenase [Oscillospiraceae bacterium]|nr:glutamate-5-semialdehyde dehydrogenase [Oscillospiraceae bacterium]